MPRSRPEYISHVIATHMEEHGLFEAGWSYDFVDEFPDPHTNATCDYRRKKLSFKTSYVFRASSFQLSQLALHEVAHALVPMGGHRREWLTKARSIGYRAPWSSREQGDDDVWRHQPRRPIGADPVAAQFWYASRSKALEEFLRTVFWAAIGGFSLSSILLRLTRKS